MYLILRNDYSVQIYVLQRKDLMKFHLVLNNSIEPIIDVVIVDFFWGEASMKPMRQWKPKDILSPLFFLRCSSEFSKLVSPAWQWHIYIFFALF